MRLNRYVGSASGLSRRGADEAIAAGRVQVDGQTGLIGQTVEQAAAVTLDGIGLSIPLRFRYVLLHKPTGYIVSRRQQGNAPTIYDLDPAFNRLRPVGRLDKDSSGLLLLSDDGDFIQAASHPSAGKQKIYELGLDRVFTSADTSRLDQGVMLEDGLSRVQLIDTRGANLTVGLTEGRNRQLRRTFAALGYEIKRLHRVAFGQVKLGPLPAGGWTECDGRPVI